MKLFDIDLILEAQVLQHGDDCPHCQSKNTEVKFEATPEQAKKNRMFSYLHCKECGGHQLQEYAGQNPFIYNAKSAYMQAGENEGDNQITSCCGIDATKDGNCPSCQMDAADAQRDEIRHHGPKNEDNHPSQKGPGKKNPGEAGESVNKPATVAGDSCWGCGPDYKGAYPGSAGEGLTTDPQGRSLCANCYWDVNDMNEGQDWVSPKHQDIIPIEGKGCPECGSDWNAHIDNAGWEHSSKQCTSKSCGYNEPLFGDMDESANAFVSMITEFDFEEGGGMEDHIQSMLQDMPPEHQIDHAYAASTIFSGLPDHKQTPEAKAEIENTIGDFIEHTKDSVGAGGHQMTKLSHEDDQSLIDMNRSLLTEWFPDKESFIHFEELAGKQHNLRSHGAVGHGYGLNADTKKNARDHLVKLVKTHGGNVKKTDFGSTTDVFIPHERSEIEPNYHDGTHLTVNYTKRAGDHGALNIKMRRGMQKIKEGDNN